MLLECKLSTTLVRDLSRGQMPSVDKILKIAQYLETSVEYLMGVTNDPTLPNKEKTPTTIEVTEVLKIAITDILGHDPTDDDVNRIKELVKVFFKKFD